MSVYHSIKSAQEATESFINLDLGMDEEQESQQAPSEATQTVAQRSSNERIRTYSSAHVKQQMFERSTQKVF